MTVKDNIRMTLLILSILAGHAVQSSAEGAPPRRNHTPTRAAPLNLVPSDVRFSNASTQVTRSEGTTILRTNSLPDHKVGRFPHRANPNRIAARSATYQIPEPAQSAARAQGVPLARGTYFGVAKNGLPTGLMAELGWRADAASPLIGFAADGFPIYALTASADGMVKTMRSSWQLKTGQRPGRTARLWSFMPIGPDRAIWMNATAPWCARGSIRKAPMPIS